MATKAQKQSEVAEAIRELRKLLKPGDRVYSIIRHVSSSGMSRRIDFYTIKGNRPMFLTWYIGRLLGYKRPVGKDGIVVGGCGMDMCFHIVYELGRTLFPKGYTPAKIGMGMGRNGSPADKVDPDGGYALRSEQL